MSELRSATKSTKFRVIALCQKRKKEEEERKRGEKGREKEGQEEREDWKRGSKTQINEGCKSRQNQMGCACRVGLHKGWDAMRRSERGCMSTSCCTRYTLHVTTQPTF